MVLRFMWLLIILCCLTACAPQRVPAATLTPQSYLPLIATPAIWKPPLNTPWQWQLDGVIDQTVNAVMFDIDLFDTEASLVAALRAQGRVWSL